MAVDLGELCPLTYDVVNAAGVLTTPATIVLTITLPDRTVATPAVPAPATAGHYQVDYPTVQAGRHEVRWVTTGPTTATTDVFDVRPAASAWLVSLADVKAHLNITSAASDDELRGWIEAATRLIEDRVGPVAVRSYTDVLTGGQTVALPHYPVVALTSTTSTVTGGVADPVTALDFDPNTGLVWRPDGLPVRARQRITYLAGRAVVPANLSGAAKMIVKFEWDQQRGGGGVRVGGEQDAVFVEGYGLVPARAWQMLTPDLQHGAA